MDLGEAVKDWQSVMRQLADTFKDLVVLEEGADDRIRIVGGIPVISIAIDQKCDALLEPHAKEDLIFNPYLVETLIEECQDKLNICASLRSQAQALERDVFQQGLDLRLRESTIATLSAEYELFFTYESQFLQNQVKLAVREGEVSAAAPSEGAGATYAGLKKARVHDVIIDALCSENEARLEKYSIEGDANNLTARFDWIKRRFDKEMIGAYRRARAIGVGLKEIYGIEDTLAHPTSTNYFDILSDYVEGASEKFMIAIQRLRFATVIIPFHQDHVSAPPPTCFMSVTDFRDSRTKLKFDFAVGHPMLERDGFPVIRPRLRGLDLWLTEGHGYHGVSPYGSQLVCRGALRLPPQSKNLAPFDADPVLPSTIVRHFSNLNNDADVLMARHLHNLDPVGAWQLSLDPGLLRAEAIADTVASHDAKMRLENMFLRLKIAYQPA